MHPEPVASIDVDAIAPGGRVVRCEITIHAPEWQPAGEYGCAVVTPNDDKFRIIYGDDSLQALTLAIRFLSRQLRS